MRWAESDLFDFSEVIAWVPIEDHFSNRDQRVVLVRPNFGYVEWIEFTSLSLLESHDLNVKVPAREVTAGNSII